MALYGRSRNIVLILFAIWQQEVYGIRGASVTHSEEWDEWTNKLHNKGRKLGHDIIGKVSKTDSPSSVPSASPRPSASQAPSFQPSAKLSLSPSQRPSFTPTKVPTVTPTAKPSDVPSTLPSNRPSQKPSLQPSLVPTESPAPSASPTFLIESIVNEKEDGTLEYITDCVAELPKNVSNVSDQVVQFQYKLFLQEGTDSKEVVGFVENKLHTNVTAEFLDCPYKNLTGLPFEIRSVNSFPKDVVLKSCDENDVTTTLCFLIDAAFTVEIFSYIRSRRLQQGQSVDLRITEAFGPFLDTFFSSEWFSAQNKMIFGVNFEGFTNAETGLPTYGGNGELDEGDTDASGLEGEVASDGDVNKGPMVAGILAVSAAAVILVVVVAIAYRKRKEDTRDLGKLQERGTIRPEESLAKAMDSLDDDSIISKDEYAYSLNPTERAYIIPDDASTAAGSAILREYSNKYAPNEKVTFRPAFITTSPMSAASVLPSSVSRNYNSSDTVDL